MIDKPEWNNAMYPIQDALEAECRRFMERCGHAPEREKRRMIRSIIQLYIQRRRSGDMLPKPAIDPARRPPTIYESVVIDWIGALIEEINGRKGKRYG